MAKSLRSKTKRSFRSKKREEGVYAVHAAARLQRLNAKLTQNANAPPPEKADEDADAMAEDATQAGEQDLDNRVSPSEPMAVDSTQSQRISTHGPRGSRREEWRKSKGMVPRPEPKGLNRQGIVAARRKSGRAKRRR